jgi:hypothetical protein
LFVSARHREPAGRWQEAEASGASAVKTNNDIESVKSIRFRQYGEPAKVLLCVRGVYAGVQAQFRAPAGA